MARTNRKPKGRARKDRDIDREEKRTRTTTTAADNDPSWYANTPALLRDAASIPFSNAVGLPFKFGNTEGSLPGVMGLKIRLVPGSNDFSDSPINIAARNIYSWVRHANSGSRNYDSPNLMMYIMAMDSLYSVYSHCARMYGLIRVYAQKNRYYPRAFFDCVGWDYDDFVANQAQFRLWLNTFVERVGSMCVPASMTFTLRHMWMFQNVWLDGPTSKAQSYFFYPEGVLRYYYDAESSEYPIQLRNTMISSDPMVAASKSLWSVARVTAAIDAAVKSIMESEDLAIMSGDILKAYGENGVWRLVPIHEDFVVLPTYSQEVMYQIHNSTCHWNYDKSYVSTPGVWIAEYADATTNRTWLKTMVGKDLTDPKSILDYNYTDLVRGYVYGNLTGGSTLIGETVLDFHHEDVTPEDVMVGTRLTCVPEISVTVSAGTSQSAVALLNCGSEVCVGRWVVRYARNAETGAIECYYRTFSDNATASYWTPLNGTPSTGGEPKFAQSNPAIANLFEFAPFNASLTLASSAQWSSLMNNIIFGDIIADVENYTTVNYRVIKNMHLAALMSEFSVPQMGAIGNHINM